MPNRLTELIAEAKRRRVFRTAGVYLVAVWGLSQGAAELGPLFGAPDAVVRYGVLTAIGLLPVVVILAWMFDIGRSGIVRDPQDVLAEEEADEELASQPTMLGEGNAEGVGAVVIRWQDADGDHAELFLDAFYIGRGVDCRVRFYDPLVSRRHARVYHEEGTWLIEDLGSRNGTIVDDKKVLRQGLSATHAVRMNDAGPALRLEFVPPGPATKAALSQFSASRGTAHVRTAAADAPTSSSRASARD